MILDSSTLDAANAIESMLGEDPPRGEIKPELLESVLEIATSPCEDIPTAGAELSSLRALVLDRRRMPDGPLGRPEARGRCRSVRSFAGSFRPVASPAVP